MKVLRDLVAEVEARELELEQREAAIAQAMELLNESAAVQMAHKCGQEVERGRLVALIDLQLEQLKRGGVNATCLETLRRIVLEAG